MSAEKWQIFANEKSRGSKISNGLVTLYIPPIYPKKLILSNFQFIYLFMNRDSKKCIPPCD